jgi:predicted nucleotidyltransferase
MHTAAVGIVAEYNPLHLGHLHHIKEAQRLASAEAAVIVLSPDFVQRGEPALLDKRTRARAALAAGADLVLELPTVYAAHNAGVFANAAVDILAATGAVSHISFGVETPDWKMDRILNILIDEPKAFKLRLKEMLDKGYSYVESRSAALEAFEPGSAEKIRGSNNNLALAYMLRLKRRNYKMTAVPVERIGANYHDTEAEEGETASSTAVRTLLAQGKDKEAMKHLPAFSAELLKEALKNGRAVINNEGLWKVLRPMLLRLRAEEISSVAEVREGIEHRLKREALASRTYEDWTERCSSKRYPKGRIQRHAIHVLLGLGHWTNRSFQRNGPAYIRVLAMNAKGRGLLRTMKESATLPVITRCGEARGKYAAEMMRFENLASEIWEELAPNGIRGEEHTRKIIIEE